MYCPPKHRRRRGSELLLATSSCIRTTGSCIRTAGAASGLNTLDEPCNVHDQNDEQVDAVSYISCLLLLLPDELITATLLKLQSAAMLGRCACVSKRFRRLANSAMCWRPLCIAHPEYREARSKCHSWKATYRYVQSGTAWTRYWSCKKQQVNKEHLVSCCQRAIAELRSRISSSRPRPWDVEDRARVSHIESLGAELLREEAVASLHQEELDKVTAQCLAASMVLERYRGWRPEASRQLE
eukprot:6174363-Pleurochrysis_carterae.AAC.2